jgi:glycogen(starch) synthase
LRFQLTGLLWGESGLRILHIINRYWPAIGGSEIHLGELSKRLAAEGHDVTVVTTDALDFQTLSDPRRRRITESEEDHAGVHIRRFPVRHLPGSPRAYAYCRHVLRLWSKVPIAPVYLLHRLSRFTPWVPNLWQWLETTPEPFDLVAGMNVVFEPLIEAGLRFAQRRGIPFVLYPLTHLGTGAGPGKDYLSSFYTMRHQVALARASDAVVAQTPTERSFYERQGVPGERISVVGPGVNPADILGGDAQRFRDKHDVSGPVVAFLSTVAYDKGAMQLVEAMRRLWATGCQVKLVLAGNILEPSGHYLAGLPSTDRARIRTLGPVSEEEKRDLLAAADIFAVPSRTDSFGIVYLEAWLYGKPVIGARSWGVSDLIEDGQDGLLVPFGDAPVMAQVIAYLLDHPAERATMGERGKQKTLGLHTWDHKYALVRDLYERLASCRPPGGCV